MRRPLAFFSFSWHLRYVWVIVSLVNFQLRKYFSREFIFWEHSPDREMLDKKPEEVIKKAVWGMLPKNKLSRKVFSKLKVYKGNDHPHIAQMPTKGEKR